MNFESSPGWDAIDNILNKIYSNQKPKHFAPETPFNLGGSAPLDGVSVYYDKENGFYHYITYGLTELHQKESDNDEYSGWGFELTFKLKSNSKMNNAPKWPVNMLQEIAKIVFDKELEFDEFNTLSSGPITSEKSSINGLLFILDNQLGERDSEYGKFKFLQIFGLTEKEFDGITNKTIDRRDLIKKEQVKNPLLITDINK
ncbi:suppressor of fused domain protein [Algibacter lectus]|uniref:suppressor of fused domain protein n=1 Tax=Algibacter lectus TaxID=221126 RepID=UPI0026EBD7D4|nr:suppressor of fused domain protein [Algibacter lectus]MDO7136107.1 suppressor of fused domain protein [Algibacter lectus]